VGTNKGRTIELKQLDADRKFDQLFAALESKNPEPDKGIFYEGQIFDAYSFIADKIRTAQKSIILAFQPKFRISISLLNPKCVW